MSDEYIEQYNNAYLTASENILNNKNIIICGPDKSGKTYLQKQIQHLLKQNNYYIYYGVDDYVRFNRLHGRTQDLTNFWIEEVNKEKIGQIIDDFNYIELSLQYN